MGDWTPFVAKDPFNDNYVEGEISHHHGDDYGALKILKVNGDKAPQLIYCTPKIAYPFDQHGNWHFPKARAIERYEKLDGTNIFAYRYNDVKGKEYLSYKTRLLPFVGDSRFGPFLDMWREVLKEKPFIEKLPWIAELNLSFELFGARNPHLVRYKVPLDAALLFGRLGQKILPPTQIHMSRTLGLPLRGTVYADYIWHYGKAQEGMENGLREVEDGYEGVEGEVWYLQDETGTWTMFKCKPESLELIHWSQGGIGKNIIRATCENAFENWDVPTVDQVKELLIEEFSAEQVDKSERSIIAQLEKAIAAQQLKLDVLEAYRGLGMSIVDQKVEVMRALSGKFERKMMGKVFAIIWAHVAR